MLIEHPLNKKLQKINSKSANEISMSGENIHVFLYLFFQIQRTKKSLNVTGHSSN